MEWLMSILLLRTVMRFLGGVGNVTSSGVKTLRADVI